MYYYGPMNGYNEGWGILMAVIWLLLFVAVAYVVIRLLRHRETTTKDRLADPLDIIKERYAKGEITKEQFEQFKKDLK